MTRITVTEFSHRCAWLVEGAMGVEQPRGVRGSWLVLLERAGLARADAAARWHLTTEGKRQKRAAITAAKRHNRKAQRQPMSRKRTSHTVTLPADLVERANRFRSGVEAVATKAADHRFRFPLSQLIETALTEYLDAAGEKT